MKQTITITEALQELKTIDDRISKKHRVITDYLYRQNTQRDPFEKDGGSTKLIAENMQAIRDLMERKVAIRSAIHEANHANTITMGKTTRTIADWLVWRRDVAPSMQQLLQGLYSKLQNVRVDASRKNLPVVSSAPSDVTLDIVVNIDEAQLVAQIEELSEILSTLDGQLSLKNATITVTV